MKKIITNLVLGLLLSQTPAYSALTSTILLKHKKTGAVVALFGDRHSPIAQNTSGQYEALMEFISALANKKTETLFLQEAREKFCKKIEENLDATEKNHAWLFHLISQITLFMVKNNYKYKKITFIPAMKQSDTCYQWHKIFDGAISIKYDNQELGKNVHKEISKHLIDNPDCLEDYANFCTWIKNIVERKPQLKKLDSVKNILTLNSDLKTWSFINYYELQKSIYNYIFEHNIEWTPSTLWREKLELTQHLLHTGDNNYFDLIQKHQNSHGLIVVFAGKAHTIFLKELLCEHDNA